VYIKRAQKEEDLAQQLANLSIGLLLDMLEAYLKAIPLSQQIGKTFLEPPV
jgi:hypothetical protein